MDPNRANSETSGTQARLPASVTSFRLNLIALGLLFVALYVLRTRRPEHVDPMMVLLGAVALPVIIIDLFILKVHRRESSGLEWDKPRPPDLGRVVTKLLGLAFTIGLIALAYWTFPEYHGSFYDPLFGTLRQFWISLVVMAVTYVWFVDGLMRQPKDAYFYLGRLVLGRASDLRGHGAEIANHFLGWLVKAFFFPLMFIWLHGSVHDLMSFDLSDMSWSNLRAYDFLFTLAYGVDLLFTTAGYALSMRVIDSHIRTAEPTIFGWVVALFCYQPFFSLMEAQYVSYGGGIDFRVWLAAWPTLRWVWIAAIVALLAVYSLATVAFGVRFSNLTHRGILTGGPYRFSKHPAYISKNLSWWLISIPCLHFLHSSGGHVTVDAAYVADAVRHSLALGCVNTIYFLRARTEERHLSRDPDYVAYALWMNEHGLLRFVGRWVPALRYRPPTQAAPVGLPASAA